MEVRKRLFRALAALVFVAVSLAGCAARPGRAPAVTAKAATTDDPAPSPRAASRDVELVGVLVPDRTVSLYAKLSGQARVVAADVGDKVSKGELLVQIDTKELDAQLAVAEAQLAGVTDQAAQAEIGVDTARLNLEMAQRAYDRTKTLLDSKVITESQLDDAQTKLDLAKAAFENAQRQLQTVGGSGVAQARAQADSIKVQISNSTVTSPIDGTVITRAINPGELVSPSSSLMSVSNTATLRLQGTVSQEDVVRLAVGMKAKVSVDASPGLSYQGRVMQIGPIAASTGQYFPVVISLKNDGKLLAGMTARATIEAPSSHAP